ncbi:MAG: phenylalanine--tRNA ligase subunit beta [Rhodospirillales bacterium]|nr:phenylalanine--tRNA ligase subunit beta [Rhodospirillales bacterium]MBO6788613.1 phenylalanine--tRNA ligase subunit beta [Rhodospirillales bacterium]
MKFTLSWLKEHLDTNASLTEITDALTMVGLELEGVEDRAKGLETFVTAKVIEAKQHPNADRLRVCQVDPGNGETVELVCGAPNARTGMIGVFAPGGSYIPGIDVTLKPTEIRGVLSNGMLLSEREMGISDEHDGIVELPEDTPIGKPAVDIMGLADPIIDIAITPNRGDCLGVRGVARDLAAAGIGSLKPLANGPVPGSFESPIKVHLEFDDPDNKPCPYFVGRYVKGVTNGESPDWLKEKLLAIGLRPISALVDITNLMTIDLNRPLHVFDADKVKGDIRVRLSKSGEKMLALNEKEYTFDDEMTLITDDNGPEGLGGVMGGEVSGVTEETVNVFIESAYFDPVRTAMTGRKLQIISDARYRFERGIDPAFLETGMEIATRLVMDLCGGEPSEVVVAGGNPDPGRSLDFRPDRVRELTGVEVTRDEIQRILAVLGFEISGDGDTWQVQIPSWRSDIVHEACLVEEVIRINGFDNIPATPLPRETTLPKPAMNESQKRRAIARRTLAARSLTEAVTYSFMGEKEAALFADIPDSIRIGNPISSELSVMRPSALANLIQAAGRNAARGFANADLFEVGPEYFGDGPDEQRIAAAGIRTGQTGPKHWSDAPAPVDAYMAKADAMAVLEALGAPVGNLQVFTDVQGYYHPGRAGELRLGPKNTLARFGEVNPKVLRALDVKGPVVAFEIYPDAVPQPKAKSAARPLLTLSAFQPIERDFAFVVDADVEAAEIVKAARGAEKVLIDDVRVFDVFEGASLGEGKKSLAITVVLQPTENTLTDEEIEGISQKIVQAVEKATGGTLRG